MQQKEYIPIVLSDIDIKTTKRDYLEEKLPILNNKVKQSEHQNSMSSPSLQYMIQSSIKPIVFPNILQKTKVDILRYRKHQLALVNGVQEQAPLTDIRKQNKQNDYSSLKINTQVSKISQRPIITELTLLGADNLSLSPKSNKFRSMSPQEQSILWQINNKVNRINKAYEIQREIHHLERFKTQWKTDVIQQYLQQKIIQTGLNTKKGLRPIFVLIYLPYQNIQLRSSQTEVKQISNETQLRVFPYYIPLYEKIINDKEINENFIDWLQYFLDILHYKHYIQNTKVFTLDSVEISSLNQIPQYEKIVYINTTGDYDFWFRMKNSLNLTGEFQYDKYARLATKLVDLKSKDDVQKFFSKRENLLPYYFKQLNMNVSNLPSQYYIDIEINAKEPDDVMFQQSIIQMNEKEQDTYLKLLQQYIRSNKSKYSNKLKNLEETMRQRLQLIKQMRRQSIQIKMKSKKFIRYDEEEHFERRLLYEDQMTIEEIKEDAIDHIQPQSTHVFRKKQKEMEQIEDPFQSFQPKDNQKFKEILQLINVEKIVLEKNLTRQDIYHYLSLFKALMDSDTPKKIKDVKYPTLFISLDQLRRGVPFIALYKNKVNTKKLAEVYSRKYNYCEFMEFLDIFTSEYKVSEQELLQMEQEIIFQDSQVTKIISRQNSNDK